MTSHLSLGDLIRIGETIQAVEFDHPFVLHPDGHLTDAVGEHAPEVYHDDDPAVELEIHGDWEPVLHGCSGQYSYQGPVMHSSEFIGGGIADRLLNRLHDDGPTTFVVVSVEVLPEDDDPEPAPAGWTILRKKA